MALSVTQSLVIGTRLVAVLVTGAGVATRRPGVIVLAVVAAVALWQAGGRS